MHTMVLALRATVLADAFFSSGTNGKVTSLCLQCYLPGALQI